MEQFLGIGLGGFLGANARYWISAWAAGKWGAAFPYGTLLVNVTGSLALGFFLGAATDRFIVDPRWRMFIAIGFLGAFTTFSTYTYESAEMLTQGLWLQALANLLLSNGLGLAAACIGISLGRMH